MLFSSPLPTRAALLRRSVLPAGHFYSVCSDLTTRLQRCTRLTLAPPWPSVSHFESALPVSEEETINRFMNYVKRAPGGSGKLTAGGKRGRSGERESKRKKRASRKAQEAEEDAGVEVEAEDDEARLYCFCRRVSYGDMIACDNTRCRYEWFHLPCVGLETGRRPRGKWYCPECARDRDSSDEGHRK